MAKSLRSKSKQGFKAKKRREVFLPVEQKRLAAICAHQQQKLEEQRNSLVGSAMGIKIEDGTGLMDVDPTPAKDTCNLGLSRRESRKCIKAKGLKKKRKRGSLTFW